MEDARDGKRVASQDTMEATQQRASDMIDDLLPDDWKQDDAQSDFDLIALTLDRMEAAVGAGQYAQAEQSRLEAYAFFEFGPELSLRTIAPAVVGKVEGLIWFGADGKEGLANLIARKKPRRDVHETRLALDDALQDGAGSLGEGATAATAVINAAVIVFREGLEAVLILAAVMASLSGAARAQRRPMLLGALLALLASVITFILARTVLTDLARYGEKLEAVVGLIAIAVLLLVLNWFFHKVYWTEHIKKFNKRRRRLLGVAAGGLVSAQVLGFVLLGFSTVYREGFETVLFLQALELNSGLAVVLEGVALGFVLVGAVAVATFVLERKLPYREDADRHRPAVDRGPDRDDGQDGPGHAGRGLGADHPCGRRDPLLGGHLAGGVPDRRDDGGPARRRRVRDRQLLPGRAAQAPPAPGGRVSAARRPAAARARRARCR